MRDFPVCPVVHPLNVPVFPPVSPEGTLVLSLDDINSVHSLPYMQISTNVHSNPKHLNTLMNVIYNIQFIYTYMYSL